MKPQHSTNPTAMRERRHRHARLERAEGQEARRLVRHLRTAIGRELGVLPDEPQDPFERGAAAAYHYVLAALAEVVA